MRSKLLETGMTIGKEYSVSFKLFPNKFSPGWHNVLHFNALTPYGKAGSRVPAIWMHDTLGNEETKPLYICADVNNNLDYCFTTKPIRRLRWTQIEVKQFKSSVAYTYQISIDGNKEHEVINKNPRSFHDVRLKVSNTKDKPQSGEIKDLEYLGGWYRIIVYSDGRLKNIIIVKVFTKFKISLSSHLTKDVKANTVVAVVVVSFTKKSRFIYFSCSI